VVAGAVNAVTSTGGLRTGAPAAKTSTGVASEAAALRAQIKRHMEVSPRVTKHIIVASTAPFNGSSRSIPEQALTVSLKHPLGHLTVIAGR
jgi:hypothetical protein